MRWPAAVVAVLACWSLAGSGLGAPPETTADAGAGGRAPAPGSAAASASARAAAPPPSAAAPSSAGSWPQWGGPRRDFHAEPAALAPTWPAEGPRRLWSRELGEGYSGIAVAGGRLFTMVRRDEQEVVVALEAASGRILWETAYPAPFAAAYDMSNGPGPHATPLVVGERVFTTGATGKLHALDAATGALRWGHDLLAEYGGTLRVNGYACSPLACGDLVIVQVGGEGRSVMAFRMADGAVAWSGGSFDNSPSSPLLIDLDGATQLIAFTYGEVSGFDPADGRLLWSFPHQTDFGLNVSTPVWGEDRLLFLSSAYGGGSRALRLAKTEAGTTAAEAWATSRMRIHFGNAVRVGGTVYASSGDFGPAPFMALEAATGRILWRDRAFARASSLAVDGRLLLLDEDGHLALATPGAEGLTVHARAKVLEPPVWTVPSLAGTVLYLRDRKQILALDLAAP